MRTPTAICGPLTVLPPVVLVWVDGHGRLVRSQLIVHFAPRRAPGAPMAWQTSVETVELRDFGAPLTISRPTNTVRRRAYSSTLRTHCAS